MPAIRRRTLLRLAGAAGAGVAAGTASGLAGSHASERPPAAEVERAEPEPYEDYTVRRVPAGHETIQSAVEAAAARDLVLVGPGVYREEVRVLDTPNLTIRGTDRNEVILDGEFDRQNGITATVDGVVVENLTARNYRYNGIYWTGVDGYRGSYLTAYNNGDYGIYAFDSVRGRFDHGYASGHPDSGFYVGQCDPCHALLTDLTAENNAIGYSGTNAGGYLTVRDSTWRGNMAGIVPNTLDSEALAPQTAARIEGNEVVGNDVDTAPAKAIGFSGFGSGIHVAGGVGNEVVDNDVRDHVNFGIVVSPMIDKQLWRPRDNVVRDNRIRESGRADLALGAPVGGGNCFSGNEHADSRPGRVESRYPCDGGSLARWLRFGDLWTTLVKGKDAVQAELGEFSSGDWREQPAPDPQPTMPDPEGPPREAVGAPR